MDYDELQMIAERVREQKEIVAARAAEVEEIKTMNNVVESKLAF